MKVLVDTPIRSAALRKENEARHAAILAELSRRGQVQLIGPVRQEVLSGIRQGKQFQFIRDRLAAFPDVVLEREDYETAAAMFNRCRARGVQESNTDFLICAVASRRDLLIYTLDADFSRYAHLLHVKRFRTESA